LLIVTDTLEKNKLECLSEPILTFESEDSLGMLHS